MYDLPLHMTSKYARKTETWGQADPRVIKLSWANQEKIGDD